MQMLLTKVPMITQQLLCELTFRFWYVCSASCLTSFTRLKPVVVAITTAICKLLTLFSIPVEIPLCDECLAWTWSLGESAHIWKKYDI